MNVETVCRTCLKENVEMKSIFCEEPDNLSTMIAACTVTTVSELDGLPGQMCLQCIENVKISFVFKQQCEKAYETLKTMLGIHIETDGISTQTTEKNTVDESTDVFNNVSATNSDNDLDEPNEHPYPTVELVHSATDIDCKELGPNEKSIQTEEICFYPCEMCESKFMNEDSLKIHRTMHKESGYKCRVCTKSYSRLTHLRRHISAMHPDFNIAKAFDDIVCSICNRQFTRMEHLRRHMLTHEGKVPKIEHELGEGEICRINESDTEMTKPMNEHTAANKLKCENDEEDEKVNKMKESIFEKEIKENALEPEVKLLENHQIEEVKLEHLSEDEYEMNQENNLHDVSRSPSISSRSSSPTPSTASSSSSSSSEYAAPKKIKRKRGRPRKNFAKTNVSAPKKLKASKGPKNQLPCGICKKTFVDPIKLEMHKLMHDRAPKIHKCTKCDKTFTRATHLKRHLITHSDIKPYSCDVCEKKFSRIDHLNIHKHHHSEIKPHICDVCQRGFTRAEHLRKHKEARHGEKVASVKSEFCDICQKGFTTPKYLQVHMRTHTDRVYACKFCDEKFGMKSELNEHMKKHVNERPFLCSECGLRFVRNDYLVIHMRRHKGEKPYKCKYCGKGFPRATDLTVHERYHTGEKTHLCTICGKGFQRAYNLLVHTRVHTGERPYQCPHCSKSFAQGNDLKAHVRRHTGERYKCDICGDGFIQGYHLTQHKRNVHGIDMKSHIRRVEKFVPPQPTQIQQSADMQDINQFQQIQQLHRLQRDAGNLMQMINDDIPTKMRREFNDAQQHQQQSLAQNPDLEHDEIKIEPPMLQMPDTQINDSESSRDAPTTMDSMPSEDHTLMSHHANLLEAQPNCEGGGLNIPFMSHLISSMHQKYKLPQ